MSEGSGEVDNPLIWQAVRGGQDEEVIIDLLENLSNNINEAGGHDRTTALHEAAKRGDEDICELLIECEADVNAVDIMNRTPMHYAARYGFSKIIDLLLLACASPGQFTNYGCTPIQEIPARGSGEYNSRSHDACKELLQAACNNPVLNMLHEASGAGRRPHRHVPGMENFDDILASNFDIDMRAAMKNSLTSDDADEVMVYDSEDEDNIAVEGQAISWDIARPVERDDQDSLDKARQQVRWGVSNARDVRDFATNKARLVDRTADYNLRIMDNAGGGDCLFYSVADQLNMYFAHLFNNHFWTQQDVRNELVAYIRSHPEEHHEWMLDEITQEEFAGHPDVFGAWLDDLQDNGWGNDLCLSMIVRMLDIPIRMWMSSATQTGRPYMDHWYDGWNGNRTGEFIELGNIQGIHFVAVVPKPGFESSRSQYGPGDPR